MTEKGEKLLILAAGLFLALAVGVVTILYRMDESEFMAEGNNEADTEETIGGRRRTISYRRGRRREKAYG